MEEPSSRVIVMSLSAALSMWTVVACVAISLWIANKSVAIGAAVFVAGSLAVLFATAGKQRLLK